MRGWQIGVVAALALAGCSYKADVLERPSFNVASSFGEPIPGLWLLYVDAAALQVPVKPSGYACSLHKFPIEIAGPFVTSTRQTLDNVVDRIEIAETPPTRATLSMRGARGVIIVRGDEVRPRLEAKPGFWTAQMEAQSTIIATITVDGRSGRLLGSTVEGTGRSLADGGIACEGGAKALAEASSQGLGDTMRKLGESMSNSERVRAAP